MSLCVGLTGGVASGKSTIAGLFGELGVPVIDADQVAREVVQPGTPGLQAVAEHFGAEFIAEDGQLNRQRMREHVFSEPAQRKQLETILHPLIRAGLKQWRDHIDRPYGLMMVPILIEGGFDTLCDRILVVDAPELTQLQRLCERDGIDLELAQSMLAAQASREERLARADDVILNTGSIDGKRSEVVELHQRYLALAATC